MNKTLLRVLTAATLSAPHLLHALPRTPISGDFSPGETELLTEYSLRGDYSHTTLDPTDEVTFWTVQEYTTEVVAVGGFWGTWIAEIKIAPSP